MGVEWYDLIAIKNGGYKSIALFTIEGISAEQIFYEKPRKNHPRYLILRARAPAGAATCTCIVQVAAFSTNASSACSVGIDNCVSYPEAPTTSSPPIRASTYKWCSDASSFPDKAPWSE